MQEVYFPQRLSVDDTAPTRNTPSAKTKILKGHANKQPKARISQKINEDTIQPYLTLARKKSP